MCAFLEGQPHFGNHWLSGVGQAGGPVRDKYFQDVMWCKMIENQ